MITVLRSLFRYLSMAYLLALLLLSSCSSTAVRATLDGVGAVGKMYSSEPAPKASQPIYTDCNTVGNQTQCVSQ